MQHSQVPSGSPGPGNLYRLLPVSSALLMQCHNSVIALQSLFYKMFLTHSVIQGTDKVHQQQQFQRESHIRTTN